MSPGKTLDSEGREKIHAKGEDQLFSLKGVLAELGSGAISGAGGYIDSPAVPAGEIWCVTTAVAWNITTATSAIRFRLVHEGGEIAFGAVTRAIAIGEYVPWSGHTWMDVDDVVRAQFQGGLAGDTVRVTITGYRMTVEV